ncbi:MAG: twin-arginine translocase TatA/TatE family subunit [Sporichthyaceae bacterium]
MGLGTPEIILIALVVLLLFGAKRMPDMARSLGESMHIFKRAVKDEDTASPPPANKPERTES